MHTGPATPLETGADDIVSLDPRLADEMGGLPRIEELTAVVRQAAAAILAIDPTAASARLKTDRTPVCNADLLAQSILVEGVARLMPALPIVSEESGAPEPGGRYQDSFALIDPLDGTREYLAGRPEFTVNLAIVIRGVPVVGIVAAPALDGLWRGVLGRGAEFLQGAARGSAAAVAIKTRPRPAAGLTAAVSRSHFDEVTARFLSHVPLAGRIVAGSSLKFCRLAEGQADLYPRLAPICEWDVGAGHAILTAAGGTMVTPEGGRVPFGRSKDEFRLHGFIACGDATIVPAIMDAVRLSRQGPPT
jgi:3'(2'), 5'-bisphosphate nucleotidase